MKKVRKKIKGTKDHRQKFEDNERTVILGLAARGSPFFWDEKENIGGRKSRIAKFIPWKPSKKRNKRGRRNPLQLGHLVIRLIEDSTLGKRRSSKKPDVHPTLARRSKTSSEAAASDGNIKWDEKKRRNNNRRKRKAFKGKKGYSQQRDVAAERKEQITTETESTRVDNISLAETKEIVNQEKKPFLTYVRRKRKASDSGTVSLLPILQEIRKDSSLDHRIGIDSSDCSHDTKKTGADTECGSSVKVQIVLSDKVVNGRSNIEQSADNKNDIQINNVNETMNEGSAINSVHVEDASGNNFEKAKRVKLNIVKDSVDVADEKFVKPAKSGGDEASREASISNSSQVCVDVEGELTMEQNYPSLSRLDDSKDGEATQSMNGHSGLAVERSLASACRRKLLVLDVNGLLADIVANAPEGCKPHTIISRKAVFKRPFCDDFLKFCFERFNVGIWTSRTKRNVELILDCLLGDVKQQLLFIWDQSHCTDSGYMTIENKNKPLLVKKLSKIWERDERGLPWLRGEFNESNTLLLDDTPYKALCNPLNTAIFPKSYRYNDEKDNSLGPGGDLRVYLEGLANAQNVQEYVKQNQFGQRPITKSNPSWPFYEKVIYATMATNEADAIIQLTGD